MIENFGKNVARLRKENGMTQEELAIKIDVKKQTISNIERGERYPTFENLEKISQILNANAIQLFGTPNEIAVSDTPVILNKIDEYNGKIQTLLKVENLLKDDFFRKEVDKVASDVQTITDFIKTKPVIDENGESQYVNEFDDLLAHDLKNIQSIADMIYDINGFVQGEVMLDKKGEPVLGENYQPRMGNATIEEVPFEKIAKAREDMEFILSNKDKL